MTTDSMMDYEHSLAKAEIAWEEGLAGECSDPTVWTTESKKSIKWKDLDYDHLKNVISFLEEGNAAYGQIFKLPAAKKELARRIAGVFDAK